MYKYYCNLTKYLGKNHSESHNLSLKSPADIKYTFNSNAIQNITPVHHFVETRLKGKHTIFHILQYWWPQQRKCIQQKRVMDFLHGNIPTKKTQEHTRAKSSPLQLFGHSTNLCRTHDHQNVEAPRVYLTYIPTMALRIKCCNY
jgi:hypothetical protein